jgi:Methyltransferase domain
MIEPDRNSDQVHPVDNRLSAIIDGDLRCHRGETEINRSVDPVESILPREVVEELNSDKLVYHGIHPEVLAFIFDSVSESSHSLETGAGKSTLAFAARGSRHITITPADSEVIAIRRFAEKHDIPLGSVTFVVEPSEQFLPSCDINQLDLVFIDGKHAFPWPMLDWFFTADKLRQGGIMLIDDVQLPSVSVLAEFMQVDPAWKMVHNFFGKTVAFEKLRPSIHEVSWHMQPFNMVSVAPPSLIRRIRGRISREVKKRTVH